jgi:hypothetical protein
MKNHTDMKNQFPSLFTADAQTGLVLAHDLANRLHIQIEAASDKVKRPGGMNYLLPASAPKEITSAILFYAIAAANQGWSAKN